MRKSILAVAMVLLMTMILPLQARADSLTEWSAVNAHPLGLRLQPSSEEIRKLLAKDAGLVIEDGARGTWSKLNGNKMKARFTVTNHSDCETIRAFELYAYAENVWGERIYGDTTVYYWTTKKNVAPGKSVYSDYVTIPDRSEVDKLHVGIKRYVFEDGIVVEHDDADVDYSQWTIEWN